MRIENVVDTLHGRYRVAWLNAMTTFSMSTISDMYRTSNACHLRRTRPSPLGFPPCLCSRFFGVEIHMRFRDHPPAHFHVRYAENKVNGADIAPETLYSLVAGRPLSV